MPQSHKDTKGEENKKLMPGNRRTIRLINYNYAQVGMYYVTICVRKDKCSRGASRSALNIFGSIDNGKVILTCLGERIESSWKWLEKQYEYVASPFHLLFHSEA